MSVTSKAKLLAKLKKKAYRDAYVEEHVKTSLPIQMIALREQRGWSQTELGQRAGGMRQNAISRLEDAETGVPSISTLLRLAQAFDVALLVKFVPFRKLLAEFSDLSTSALEVTSFDDELPELEQEVAMPTRYYQGSFVGTGHIIPAHDVGVDLAFASRAGVKLYQSKLGSRVLDMLAGLNVGQVALSEPDEMIELDYTGEAETNLPDAYKSIPSIFMNSDYVSSKGAYDA